MASYLSGCASVVIKDHVFCADKGSLGAFCSHTLTDETLSLSKSQWDDIRFGQICTMDPPGHKGETFADWKSALEKLCSDYSACTYEDKQKITSFFLRLERARNEH